MAVKPRQVNHFFPPDALQTTCDRIFTPWLRPPRLHKLPLLPSLASSRLPPPAAEIDERPSFRVRRFRLWQDNAPPLRKVILDPRRRRECFFFVIHIGLKLMWNSTLAAISDFRSTECTQCATRMFCIQVDTATEKDPCDTCCSSRRDAPPRTALHIE